MWGVVSIPAAADGRAGRCRLSKRKDEKDRRGKADRQGGRLVPCVLFVLLKIPLSGNGSADHGPVFLARFSALFSFRLFSGAFFFSFLASFPFDIRPISLKVHETETNYTIPSTLDTLPPPVQEGGWKFEI